MHARYRRWLEDSRLDEKSRRELESMSEEEIEDAFYKELSFGTGGMRGIVGVGTNRLNAYTLRKAVYGYGLFLREVGAERGVVIAHDNRHKSDEFALEAACVLAALGIRTYLFDSLEPTPLLSFAVRDLRASGGIMVTASHNPPNYNGVKMYDENGCQLVPALADRVIEKVNTVEDYFSIESLDADAAKEEGFIQHPEGVKGRYIEAVKALQFHEGYSRSLRTVFTPLHGTSREIIPDVLSGCGYDVRTVPSQMVIDPDFKAVNSPNPEHPEAFEQAQRIGHENDTDLLIATDPDSDRLGLMCRHEGEYVFLTGNQTGAMFIDYILGSMQQSGTLPDDGLIFNTVVTSEFGAAIARAYGVEVESTLTGFKFIGERMKALPDEGKRFIMGYEESYGYVLADITRDKDGVQASLMAAEMADQLKQQGMTLVDYLNSLYETYGAYRDKLMNIVLKGSAGAETIKAIMEHFRRWKPETFMDRRLLVKEDYLRGVREKADTSEPLDYPSSNVVKFIFEDDCWFVLRPSGTEPKLKIYLNVKASSIASADAMLDEMQKRINKMINPFIED